MFYNNKNDTLEDELNVPLASQDLEEWFDSIINTEEITPTKKSNLTDSISLCSSLEDLVKTFDKNVKECLVNYKDIDIGQLAPVQVRSQEDIMNDSQIWYTLTGNFGNLLPIDYWSSGQSLVKKYHDDSLNVNKKIKKSKTTKYESLPFDNFDFESDLEKHSSEDDEFKRFSLNESDDETESTNSQDDYDDDELREQLDMHSMILADSVYSDESESLFTAEQVLSEIETIMTLQDEENDLDEMTPDSGCFSVTSDCNKIHSSPINLDDSYLNYINTFALKNDDFNKMIELSNVSNVNKTIIPKSLNKLNAYQLNDLIEQIELNNKELSDILVHELNVKDELEFEKEIKNTFISLLMSIQEKRKCLLNSDRHMTSSLISFNNKKKNPRYVCNSEFIGSSYLTTVIPYNSEIKYSVQHLQILNKLLKAINEQSQQVPELLTNYILKVVCPT